MPDVPRLARSGRIVFAALLMLAIAGAAPTPVAGAEPTLIQCPDQRHVWNKWQCERNPYSFPGGGGGGCGIGCQVGRIIDRLTGGLL